MTPLSSQSKEIGDCTYTVETLGFVDARKLALRLGKLLSPAFEALADTVKTSNSKALQGQLDALDALGAGALKGLARLLQSVTEDDIAHLEALFLPRTLVKLPTGNEVALKHVFSLSKQNASEHFAGERIGDYFLWLAFGLWVTYAPFFSKVATSLSLEKGGMSLATLLQSLSGTQAPIGQSGDSSLTSA